MREQEVKEVKEVAAFFDLDGTLVAGPTLERRFFSELRWRGLIPAKNYLFWLAEALRLAPRGLQQSFEANKMYLKDVSVELAEAVAARRAPRFYREGIDRMEWHVREGHAIYLVSGTLEGLASNVALALVARLAMRGIQAKIGYCATRLEETNGHWTGGIVGAAMSRKAKECEVRRIAKQGGFSLEKCYAYGNTMGDRWMLAAVGRTTAVNPDAELDKVAGLNGWPVMRWEETEKRSEGTKVTENSAQKLREQREENGKTIEKGVTKENGTLRQERTEGMRLGTWE